MPHANPLTARASAPLLWSSSSRAPRLLQPAACSGNTAGLPCPIVANGQIRSPQPSVQMLVHESVVCEVRICREHAIDLRHLPWAELLVGVETPPAGKQALA